MYLFITIFHYGLLKRFCIALVFAASGSDFDKIDLSNYSSLVFDNDVRLGCFNVTIIDDSVLEFTESFTVRVELSAPDPLINVYPNISSITIIDDDGE